MVFKFALYLNRDQFGDLLKVDDEPQTVEAMESR